MLVKHIYTIDVFATTHTTSLEASVAAEAWRLDRPVLGDVKISMWRKTTEASGGKYLFGITVHTHFLQGNELVVPLQEVDQVPLYRRYKRSVCGRPVSRRATTLRAPSS